MTLHLTLNLTLKKIFVTSLSLFCITVSLAQDAVILDMAAAYKKNDTQTLLQLLPKARGHVLEPWAAYWTLRSRLQQATQMEVNAFYKRYADTYVEDRLRADWLLLQGQNKNWEGFATNFAAYRMRDDRDILCYANRDNPRMVEQLWMEQKEVQTGCAQVAQILMDAGQMPRIVHWRKTYAPAAPNEFPRQLTQLTEQQRNWALGFTGRALARSLDLSALEVFAKVTDLADLSDDMLQWWARAALRKHDWKLVERLISATSESAQQDPVWAEWLMQAKRFNLKKNVALAPTVTSGATASASASANALPTTPAAPHHLMDAAPSEQAIAQAKANKGLNRALYAIRIGLRAEGAREWAYEVNLAKGSMSDEARLGAAAIACEAQVWDRCINTSERTTTLINWAQRYPTPYKDILLTQAQQTGIDAAFVYGLIRQESRFVTDAKSSVGASGLMQLMPATAKWVAKRLGMNSFKPDDVHQVDINLRLGIAYLKHVLDENDGNPIYAAAAYNAGPHRVKTWRLAMQHDPAAHIKDKTLALAIWAENIPFTETRDYVKKVLANTEAYRHVLSKK